MRAPGPGGPEGAPTGPLPRNLRWKDIAKQVDQGADPASGRPIIIRDIASTDVDTLDLTSMLLLDAHIKALIADRKKMDPQPPTFDTWIPLAEMFRDDVLGPALSRRRNGAIASEIFWAVIDDAMSELKGDDAALLARILPLVWKVVDSGWNPQLSPIDRFRVGYFTIDSIKAIIEPGHKYYDLGYLGPKMLDGSLYVANAFILKSATDRPAAAAKRVVSRVQGIWADYDEAFTQIFRESGEVVYGPAKALSGALKQHAERIPNSITSLMPVKTRTPGGEKEAEMEAALNEIRVASGIVGGESYAVEAEHKGKWYPAKVLATRDDGMRYVHFVGFSKDWDEWLAPDRIRTRTQLQAGDTGWAKWNGVSYPVEVLEVGAGEQEGKVRLHWQGFSTSNDAHWISSSRVTGRGN